MGQTMKETFLQYRKLFLISAIAGMVMIPVFNAVVTQRDRNRDEVYGELFWTYGMGVYNFNDSYLKENFNVPDDSLLGDYLNVTYEYPPLNLFFFAIVAGFYPGMYGFQHIFVNAVLFFFFNLNILLVIHMGGELRKERWFWLFVGGYYVVECMITTWGGKIEPFANTLTLLSILLYRKGQWGKASFMLGVATQLKLYPIALLPYYIYKTKGKSLWFVASLALIAIILPGTNSIFSSVTMHASNDFRYTLYVTNSLFFGFAFINPLSTITLAAFVVYIIPQLGRIRKKENIYFLLLPAVFFVFRWIMPWYFFWPIPFAMAIGDRDDMRSYIRIICIISILYGLGILINISYYINSNLLSNLAGHFRFENL